MPKKTTRKLTQRPSPKESGLRQHELVERVLGDPAGFPARTQCVYGLLGKDSQAGFWRIYLSAQMDHYLRVAEVDIVTVRNSPDAAPGERLDEVWLKEDAALTETRAIPRQIRTSFLSGSLVDRLGAAAYDDVYRLSSARRPPVVAMAPGKPLTFVEGCDLPGTSYETGCGVNQGGPGGPLTSTCGTYPFFGCNPTGPGCIDTFGASCQSDSRHCSSRPSICLCDSRRRNCD